MVGLLVCHYLRTHYIQFVDWKSKNLMWIIAITGLVVIIASWWGFKTLYVDAYHTVSSHKSKDLSPGEVGDMFGMFTALFTALAFYSAGVAIWIQSQELKEQKNELKLTRLEFTVTRATNILYRQLDLFQRSVAEKERQRKELISDFDKAARQHLRIGNIETHRNATASYVDKLNMIASQKEEWGESVDNPTRNGWASILSERLALIGPLFMELATVVSLYRDLVRDLGEELGNESETHKRILATIINRNTDVVLRNAALSAILHAPLIEELVLLMSHPDRVGPDAGFFHNQMLYVGNFFEENPISREKLEEA